MNYSNVRYLVAKQPIDDRAINRQVLAALERELAAPRTGPLRILELGAGVGTMVSRLCDWGVVRRASYTLVDRDRDSLAAAREHLERWGRRLRSTPDSICVEKSGAILEVVFTRADLVDYLDAPSNQRRHDLVVANAVLDLLDLGPTLPRVWRALEGRGLYWFTINFDGETILLPELELDAPIMRLYHASMTADAGRTRAGHSRTGRRLLEAIPASGGGLAAAGSSDWVVFPRDQAYPDDEAYFLHHIVETIRQALVDHPALARADFDRWVGLRHQQIEQGQLAYVAHQLDVFGHAPGA
jgi:SAM-dependent methyltransferase